MVCGLACILASPAACCYLTILNFAYSSPEEIILIGAQSSIELYMAAMRGLYIDFVSLVPDVSNCQDYIYASFGITIFMIGYAS